MSASRALLAAGTASALAWQGQKEPASAAQNPLAKAALAINTLRKGLTQ